MQSTRIGTRIYRHDPTKSYRRHHHLQVASSTNPVVRLWRNLILHAGVHHHDRTLTHGVGILLVGSVLLGMGWLLGLGSPGWITLGILATLLGGTHLGRKLHTGSGYQRQKVDTGSAALLSEILRLRSRIHTLADDPRVQTLVEDDLVANVDGLALEALAIMPPRDATSAERYHYREELTTILVPVARTLDSLERIKERSDTLPGGRAHLLGNLQGNLEKLQETERHLGEILDEEKRLQQPVPARWLQQAHEGRLPLKTDGGTTTSRTPA